MDVDLQPLGDQRTEVVVRPRAHRHELDAVDMRQHTTAGIGVGGPSRRGDERERLGVAEVLVVAVRDLADADDDGNRRRSAHAVEPPSSTMMAPDT